MKAPGNLKRFLQGFLILGFLGLAGFLVWFLNLTKPEALEKSEEVEKPFVEVLPVRFADVTVTVDSQGLVQAKKRTRLASELSGKVVKMAPQFIVGGTFKKGEVILEIDTSNYVSAVAQAEANLADAELLLTTEEAKAAQARRDWERLGRGKPSALTVREPQIRNAKARIAAAKAALDKANRDLKRTVISSPFDATVAEKLTEEGNYLAPGSPIGEFFQTAPLEVRMPLSLDDLQYLNVAPGGNVEGDVVLSAAVGKQRFEWKARIDRTEGQIERESRALYVISEILPGSSKARQQPVSPQPGLFVNTAISGKRFERIARVPAAAFLDLERVVLVENGKLRFRRVEVLRRHGDFVYVSGGLNKGELLCLTELATMIEGAEVTTQEVEDSVTGNLQITVDDR